MKHGPYKVDSAAIKNRIDELGLTQRAMAKALGISPPAVTGLLNGTRKFQAKDASRTAAFLQMPINWVLQKFGVAHPSSGYGKLPINGYIDATSGTVTIRSGIAQGDLEEIEAPFPGFQGCAVRVRGSSMAPRYREGDIIGFTPEKNQINELVRHEAIVETADGRLLLKTIHRGTSEGLYTLVSLSPDDAPILDIQIAWAAAIDFIIPNGRSR